MVIVLYRAVPELLMRFSTHGAEYPWVCFTAAFTIVMWFVHGYRLLNV